MTETANASLHLQSMRLTIRFGSDAIIMAIGDPRSERRIVSESFPLNRSISVAANLREVATQSELFQSGYQRALVLVNADTMLVPLDEYPSEDMATLYHSAFSSHQNEELVTNVLPELRAVAVFPVNKDMKSVLAEQIPDLSFMPIVQPVWHQLYRRNFATPRKKLFAYFHDQRMELFAYAKNRLTYSNAFDGSREHDVLYYLLYAWRQLGYHQESDELLIAGTPPQKEWLMERLRQHVARVASVNPAADFGASSASLDYKIPYDLKVVFLGK